MAKFIEVKRTPVDRTFMFECDRKVGASASDTVLINVDHIVSIDPMGETCIIKLAGQRYDFHADHSALWVMGLINGNNQAL